MKPASDLLKASVTSISKFICLKIKITTLYLLFLLIPIIRTVYLTSNRAAIKYRSSGESDVLLLEISDDSGYVWMTSFDPVSINSLRH